MLDGLVITRRFDTPAWLSALTFLAGIAAGLAMATALVVAIGVPASALFNEVIGEAFMTASGLAQTLTFATPLICVGLSAAVALRLRFWNIGIEGQLWLGALGATAVALGDIGPEATRLPLMLLAAALAGAAWIALPLVLKLRLGVSEVITTLLLGSIAFLFAQHLLFGAWRDPATGFPISLAFDAAERLAGLGFGRTHFGLPIALAAALLVWFLVDVTRLGFYGRAVGENIEAARAAGVPVIAVTCAFVLLSGALSGLAGGLIVAGTEHRMSLTLGAGYTFSGIVIAFLGRFRPLATVVVAVIIGGVFTASDVFKVFYGISEAVVVLLQGLVLFGVLVAQFFGAYRISRANWGAPA